MVRSSLEGFVAERRESARTAHTVSPKGDIRCGIARHDAAVHRNDLTGREHSRSYLIQPYGRLASRASLMRTTYDLIRENLRPFNGQLAARSHSVTHLSSTTVVEERTPVLLGERLSLLMRSGPR